MNQLDLPTFLINCYSFLSQLHVFEKPIEHVEDKKYTFLNLWYRRDFSLNGKFKGLKALPLANMKSLV